eukprot:gene5782-7278_t
MLRRTSELNSALKEIPVPVGASSLLLHFFEAYASEVITIKEVLEFLKHESFRK